MKDETSTRVADKIQSIELELKNARLYNGEKLKYGELWTVDKAGKEMVFLYVVADMVVDLHEKNQFHPSEGYTRIEDSVGRIVEEKMNYKLAFFSEGSNLLRKMEETRE